MELEPLQLDYAGTGRIARRYARQRTPTAEFFTVLMGVSGWAAAAIFLLGISIGWIVTLTGPVIGLPAMVFAVLLIPMLVTSARRVRHRRAMAVLGYLRQAARLNLPFNRVLASAARSERGKLAGQITEVNDELASGARLSIALGWTVPEIPQRMLSLIEFAEQSGQLPMMLDRLLEEERRRIRSPDDIPFTRWYPPVALAIVAGCIATLSIFVFPKYVQIFSDFRIPLPAVTQWIIWCVDIAWPLAPILVIALLIACGIQLRAAVRLRRPTWIFRRLQDRVIWYLPILGTLHRDRALADVCLAVADATDAGHSLEAALTRAEQLQMNYRFERQLQKWAQGLQSGTSASEAARVARMPPLLVGLLASGESTPAFGHALRFAARYYSDRFASRRAVLAGMVLPVFTVLMGVVVAVVSLSIYLPITRLIQASAPYPKGL